MKHLYHMNPFYKSFIEYIDVILFFYGYGIAIFSSILMGIFIIIYGEIYFWVICSILFGSLLSVIGITIFIFYEKD